jgi:hypothetical protein
MLSLGYSKLNLSFVRLIIFVSYHVSCGHVMYVL